MNSARDVVAQKTKGVSLFDAWAALKNALDDEAFTSLPGKLPELEARLDAAVGWHAKQLADEKLRLKALASSFFLPAKDLTVSENLSALRPTSENGGSARPCG